MKYFVICFLMSLCGKEVFASDMEQQSPYRIYFHFSGYSEKPTFESIMSDLTHSIKIKTLSISKLKFEEGQLDELLNVLDTLPKLALLELIDCGLVDQDMEKVLNWSTTKEKLATINLAFNNIKDEGRFIPEIVPRLKVVTLILTNNRLVEEVTIALRVHVNWIHVDGNRYY